MSFMQNPRHTSSTTFLKCVVTFIGSDLSEDRGDYVDLESCFESNYLEL